MQECHLVVSRGPELETTPPDQAQTAPFHGVLQNMENVGSGVSLFRIWSGLSESNRHLNLGKVRVVKSNALERRHLAFWGRALIGK
jgi:hypothetical protein